MDIVKALKVLAAYIEKMRAIEHTGLGIAVADELIECVVDAICDKIGDCSDDIFWWLYAEPKIYHYKNRRYKVPDAESFYACLLQVYRVSDSDTPLWPEERRQRCSSGSSRESVNQK
jgi:hypothetical protein